MYNGIPAQNNIDKSKIFAYPISRNLSDIRCKRLIRNMDIEREEYLCQQQTERNRRRLEAVLAKRMGSAPRSPANARLTPLQVLSERMQMYSLSRVEPRIISSLFPNRNREGTAVFILHRVIPSL